MTRLVVVGDTLLDVDWAGSVTRVTPDAPVPVVEAPADDRRPGGAGLAAVVAAARGASVTLITALGTDDEGRELRDRLDAAGVSVVDLRLAGPTPQKLRVRAAGQSLVRVDRCCHPVVPPGWWTGAANEALGAAEAVLVADYGRGLADRALPAVRALASGDRSGPPVVWDPHRAGPQPPPQIAAVTPNAAEAAGALGEPEPATITDLADTAERLAASWGSPAVVTNGARGAVIAAPPAPIAYVPATPVPGDTCGAGDCFSAAMAVALGRGRDLHDATVAAVAAAGRFVGSGHDGDGRGHGRAERAEVPRLTPPGPTTDGDIPGPDARDLAAEVRAGGGTVVAAGGCFDLLHAGHLRTLEAARALGDCLIVCLNGDASVRRLKGSGRPVNLAPDRARLLLGLSCVDAITVFDEDTPVAALETIRPHVFVKGGDYVGMEIAEADPLATWGGRVVVLPLVAGRSTTRMIERAARRPA
jgi:D-beta-D-heptose 7-phosphate kinase / D-beta-D-heptose 1-phosphate adenosyltransferase